MTVAAPTSTHLRTTTLFPPERPLRLRSGATLSDVDVAYEVFGSPEHPAIFVCHALTGDAHVARHDDDDLPGWWDAVVGPGKAVDTDRFFVVCANVIGGCAGTTGPRSPGPDGTPYGGDFPAPAIADMVTVHRELLRHLGIGTLHAVIGGSLGGMQALDWLLRYPDSARTFLLVATAARMSTDNLAFSAAARAAIRSDPRFRDGHYDPAEQPDAGLGVARMIAHLTYLSPESLDRKFGRTKAAPERPGPATGEFTVERYLENQAHKLTRRFDANTYLRLITAMDEFDAFAEPHAVAADPPSVHLFSFAADRLFGIEHSREIQAGLAEIGVQATHFHDTTATIGHDAFLVSTSGYHGHLAATLVPPPPARVVGAEHRQGGDLRGLHGDLLDLGTCVNRYGPPPAVEEAVRSVRGEALRAHPYESEERFAAAYAGFLGVRRDHLVVGRGITEFIRALGAILPVDRASVVAPDYTDTIAHFPHHDNPPHDEVETPGERLARVERAMSTSAFVLLSNPNNPTGVYLHREDLVDICRRHPAATLVVDEAYIDFVDGDLSMMHSGLSNVVVLRSPNKPFGMAAVRTGAMWTPDSALRERVAARRLNWPLSYLDVVAAVAALESTDWLTKTRADLLADAEAVEAALSPLGDIDQGVPVHYRFLRHPDPLRLHADLVDQGIVTRVFRGDEPGRVPGLRVTTPTASELPHLLGALARVAPAPALRA